MKIAPTLTRMVGGKGLDPFNGETRARAELRALLSEARAAERDPDKHWRVERALSRLKRVSAPPQKRRRTR